MLKILTIVGARPQFIKASALSKAIKSSYSDKIKEVLLHTGQHYDPEMSRHFFEELGMEAPHYILELKDTDFGNRLGAMIEGILNVLSEESPDLILVYGDTLSTLAGSLAATNVHIPLVHIESGMRSYNRQMPEEINRVLTDQLASVLFASTPSAIENLHLEGIGTNSDQLSRKVAHSGDIMLDVILNSESKLPAAETVLAPFFKADIPADFILCTLHRAANVDDPQRLKSLLRNVNELAIEVNTRVVLPLHPRTKKRIEDWIDLKSLDQISVIPPLGYLATQSLIRSSRFVYTDSGGLQKEAAFSGKFSLVPRKETEWKDLEKSGHVILVDDEHDKTIQSGRQCLTSIPGQVPASFGDGKAAYKICDFIINHFK